MKMLSIPVFLTLLGAAVAKDKTPQGCVTTDGAGARRCTEDRFAVQTCNWNADRRTSDWRNDDCPTGTQCGITKIGAEVVTICLAST